VTLFHVIIPGRVAIKKNSRRLIANRRRMLILPSKVYMQWEADALRALTRANRAQGFPLPGQLKAYMLFRFKNRSNEPDIDNLLGGPLDVLQKAGIIENDRQILVVNAEKRFGETPSVEIILEAFMAEQAG
jgi:Holliday junction resolvase RusA-like endonuclease